MIEIETNLLPSNQSCVNMELVTVSLETAKRLADHHLALAQYWRKVARLPPVLTENSQRRMAEMNHR